MPIYLNTCSLGSVNSAVGLRIEAFSHCSDAFDSSSVVVNCSGLAARELVPDANMYASRGQVVVVERGENVDELIFDPDGRQGVTYIVPRSHDCVLGGTDERGEDLIPDVGSSDAIVSRCAELNPTLRDVRRIRELVGLRPCRNLVRLESQVVTDQGLIVHNYGHGGAGVTLSWGVCGRSRANH